MKNTAVAAPEPALQLMRTGIYTALGAGLVFVAGRLALAAFRRAQTTSGAGGTGCLCGAHAQEEKHV